MIKRFFVSAVDARTNEPVLAQEVDALDFDHAVAIARTKGRALNQERECRVTSCTEQPTPETSWFLGQCARRGAEAFQQPHHITAA